ncbi:alpha/beta hydrolase [Nitrospirillum sp. BR 11828]|uniref:alpha/beta hydrolase family protein n=1 Tax=Nitrospirillum sp. BR 11828 TaxID=3104325 RepID=UPI002ACA0D01|nr:alpha/beta hydrolase [Nitrospirillum sp. BR 11828]MDZ5646001.1 alpha/beta hydrolase [Nitrospirillum sp. BR 11828]
MRRRALARVLAALVLVGGLAACTGIHGRQDRGPTLAQAGGWRWDYLSADSFDLATAVKPYSPGPGPSGDVLTVYIEGDGMAYLTPSQPAMDPTPTDPLALRLAMAHPGGGPVAYLARPCQYVMETRPRNCQVGYWTKARLAPEVVDSASLALDRLKADAHAQHLVLVGYSGGGGLAAVLAERRADVAGLVTVSGNLDFGLWTRTLDLTPLSQSIDPVTDAARLSHLPQVHFVGADDKVVDGAIAQSFVAHQPPDAPARIITIPGQDHGCCWAASWAALSRRPEMAAIPGWLP